MTTWYNDNNKVSTWRRLVDDNASHNQLVPYDVEIVAIANVISNAAIKYIYNKFIWLFTHFNKLFQYIILNVSLEPVIEFDTN